ncbi:MAG: hypothetical protein ACRDZW_10580, partial [Acidimicrobiales bacterium]
IEWEPTWGCDPGRIDILVYHRLVRGGRGDRRAGYVQVLPGAVAAAWARHHLSVTARALLRRLVADVDHRTHALTGSLRQLTARYGLSRQRLTKALDELAAADLLGRLPDRIELRVYTDLVRLAAPVDLAEARSNRAAIAPESRAARVENARPSSPLDGTDQDLEPETTRAPEPATANSAQGQGGVGTIDDPDANLAALALALPPATHHELLADPAQAPGRQALRRRLDRLVATLGQADAVATMTRDWPDDVDSAMALANNRAERRLGELAGSTTTAAGVAALAAQQAARRRADALKGARNLGQAWASAGIAAEDVAAQFVGDEEAQQVALAAFHGAEGGPVPTAPMHTDGAHGRSIGTRQRRDAAPRGPRRLAFSLAAVAGAETEERPDWYPAQTSEGGRA